MKRYWPFMGAVGVAATIGLYAYVNRDPLYEEPETEEFLEEETEYEAEVPDNEITGIPAPYTTPKATKNKEKTIPRSEPSQKYQQEQKTRRPYHPSFPRSSGLEETLEEEQPYDLPSEKRIALTTNWTLENVRSRMEELEKNYQAALDVYDFKVAASYIVDFQRFMEAEKNTKPEAYQKIENDLAYHMTTKYDSYLSEAIEDCSKHDFGSVYAKVMWMNIFLVEHPEIFSPDYVEKSNLAAFLQKGNQALDAIEYCNE